MMKHRGRRHCFSLILGFACILLFLASGTEVSASENHLDITNVKLDRMILTPGEQAGISFRLTRDARVTLLIYTPDYEVIRKLADDQPRPAGVNTLFWDGQDDAGQMVPNEAYIFSITATDGDRGEVVYNPTARSGGEITDVRIERTERTGGGYRIHYVVPVPSRVNIRAGVRKGPMFRTILDWKPMPAGNYVQAWDGMDDTGRIRVMDQAGSHLYIQRFSLPENTIFVQGSSDDYLSYQENLQKTVSSADKGVVSFQKVRRSALSRMDRGISSAYFVPRSRNVSPAFAVYLSETGEELAQEGITAVSGSMALVIRIASESLRNFNESRYEIVVFADNKRFDEEENAHSPYTYHLDTRKLSNGEHLITINQASLTGQVGAYSFRINVDNQGN